MRERHGHTRRRIASKALVAVWIGLTALGFVVQTTEGFGTLTGLIAWFLVGSTAFLLLLAFGARGLIHWLLDSGGLGDREANAREFSTGVAGHGELGHRAE